MSDQGKPQTNGLAESPYAVLQRIAQAIREEAGIPVKSINVMIGTSQKEFDRLAAENPDLLQTRAIHASIHLAMGDTDLEIAVDALATDEDETEDDEGRA